MSGRELGLPLVRLVEQDSSVCFNFDSEFCKNDPTQRKEIKPHRLCGKWQEHRAWQTNCSPYFAH